MLQFNEPDIDGPVAQPSNTITSLSYVILAFLLFSHDKLIALITLVLSLTTIFFHAKNTLLGQWLDISSIVLLVVVLAIKGYPFNRINQTNLFLGIGLILIGEIFWIIDIKHLSIIPKNHMLTGHGVWHILTAISVWFVYQSLPIK